MARLSAAPGGRLAPELRQNATVRSGRALTADEADYYFVALLKWNLGAAPFQHLSGPVPVEGRNILPPGTGPDPAQAAQKFCRRAVVDHMSLSRNPAPRLAPIRDDKIRGCGKLPDTWLAPRLPHEIRPFPESPRAKKGEDQISLRLQCPCGSAQTVNRTAEPLRDHAGGNQIEPAINGKSFSIHDSELHATLRRLREAPDSLPASPDHAGRQIGCQQRSRGISPQQFPSQESCATP